MCDLDIESANDEKKIKKVNVFCNRMTILHLTKQSIKHTLTRKKESERWSFLFYDEFSINKLLTVLSMLKTQTEWRTLFFSASLFSLQDLINQRALINSETKDKFVALISN